MAKQRGEKFEFGIDFQELILKYTLTDKQGYKALELYEDTYFALLNHQVVAYALKKYYKKHKRIPEKPFLKEHLRTLYHTQKKVFSNLNEDDRRQITELVDTLYEGTAPGAQELMLKVVNFARFVNFKSELENIDINNFDSYQEHISKLRAAMLIGEDQSSTLGSFVISGIHDRAYKRDAIGIVNPTPYWQFNRLLNGGGIAKHSLWLVASEAKRFKTGFLLNLCKNYLRRRKRIIYYDLENGEEALTVRTEQALMSATMDEILSNDLDPKLIKLLRKYRRLGAELVIKRFPAYTTTTLDFQAHLDECKQQGLIFNACVIDYGDLMGSITGKKEEYDRINDAYVDMKNFTKFNDFDWTFTASHVTRMGADKHRATRYEQNDLAKCIDKMRHCDGAIGLNETTEEAEQGIMRAEIIDQRNGSPNGKVLFWVDIERQLMREFTQEQVDEYFIALGEENPDKKKKRKAENLKKNDL